MERFGRALALAIVFAGLFPAASLGGADATLTGKLTGAKLPAPGAGVVLVAALRLTDGVVTAGGYANGGRFTLTPPAGPYAILASVIPFRGATRPLERVADFVSAKPGKRTVLKPTLKKRKKHKRRAATRRRSARAAFVDVDYTAIWIKDFETNDSSRDFQVMRAGMRDMITTDVVNFLGTDDCPGVVVERARLADVLAELRLQESPRLDPTTRVRRDRLIAHNATITGNMAVSGDQLTLSATYKNERTGKSRTVSHTGPKDAIFDIEQALIPKLQQAICPHTPKTYTGTFNGTWRTDLNNYTVSWSGSAVLELTDELGAPPPGWPPGTYAQYALKSSHIHATLTGTRNGAFAGSCSVQGETDFELPAITGINPIAVQTGDDEPSYYIALTGRGDEQIPYTETGQGCNQQNPQYPLTGIFYAFTPQALTLSAPDQPLTANTSWDQFGLSRYTSEFSFTPG
jgi:hypothetical protein